MLRDYLKQIADALRNALGTTEPINAQEFPDKVAKVYDAGKTAEWNAFWDGFQNNGNRIAYQNAFMEWIDDMFYPKYNLTLGVGSNTGSSGAFTNSKIINIKKRLEDCGVNITFPTNSVQGMFLGCTQTEEIPTIDHLGNTSNYQYAFLNCSKVKTIHIKNGTMQYIQNSFNGCSALETLIFENVVISATGSTGFNLSGSPLLTKDSLLNLLNALEDLEGTGTTRTVTLGATNLAKLTDEEKAIATEKGWTLA